MFNYKLACQDICIHIFEVYTNLPKCKTQIKVGRKAWKIHAGKKGE